LLPSDYHHYHAPVTGKLVYYKAVPGIYFGIQDAPEWFHEGNVGASDADFSIFEKFHRDVFIFETDNYGKVAMVAVGLNTISKIEVDMKSVNTIGKFQTATAKKPIWVYKGTRLGCFKYGGSLNILLFEKNVYQASSVHQGQRVGTLIKRNAER
jgi:phosphatidylserine decarboxylase